VCSHALESGHRAHRKSETEITKQSQTLAVASEEPRDLDVDDSGRPGPTALPGGLAALEPVQCLQGFTAYLSSSTPLGSKSCFIVVRSTAALPSDVLGPALFGALRRLAQGGWLSLSPAPHYFLLQLVTAAQSRF
jgi:hypothetical protein